MIGYGAYAQVLEVRNSRTGERHALKVVEKKPLAVRGMLQQLAREFGVQRGVHHPNIVCALELAEDNTHAYLLLELCEGGSVWKATHSFPNSCVPEDLTACWLYDATCGIAHLHDLGLVHRDVKLENLLLDGRGHVRLADFGWCAFEADKPQGMCGTPQLAPPEVSRGEPQTNKVDIWSIGACLVQLLTGCALDGPQDAWLPTGPQYSAAAQDLAQRLLQLDARRRLSARNALERPFLKAAKTNQVSSAAVPAGPVALQQKRTMSPRPPQLRRAVSPKPQARQVASPQPPQRLPMSPQQLRHRQLSPPRRSASPAQGAAARAQSPIREPPVAAVAALPQSPAMASTRAQSPARGASVMLPPPVAALSSTAPGSSPEPNTHVANGPAVPASQQSNAEELGAASGEAHEQKPGEISERSSEVIVDQLLAKSEARKKSAAEASRTHKLVEEHAREARLSAKQAMAYAEQALALIQTYRAGCEATPLVPMAA